MMERIPVAAVVGPTATGKSRLAVELAIRFRGEVVSADSMQIYRGLKIGTAQPEEAEKRGVPHYLIGFLEPGKPFSVADYVALASERIREIHRRGCLPVIAGGTGLYVASLLRQRRFGPEGRDEALRRELMLRAESEGPQALWEELNRIDPQSAARIHPNNLGRLIRAIEVYRMTGVTMTEQNERSQPGSSPYDTCMIGLDYRDRQKLYDAIDRRVDRMMERGLLAEAERVLSIPDAATAGQAIGYKEFLPYFQKKCSLSDAVDRVKRESRRYAKRQLTWFRRQENAVWIMVDDYPCFEAVYGKAAEIFGGRVKNHE